VRNGFQALLYRDNAKLAASNDYRYDAQCRVVEAVGRRVDSAFGRVLVDLVDFPAAPEETDADRGVRFLLKHLGMQLSSSCLLPVPRSDAEFIAATILSPNPWGAITSPDAEAKVRKICCEFDEDVRVLSNWRYEIDRKKGTIFAQGQGPDLLGMTLERGIIALDSRRVGILWIGDED
jgi:hypothetical protein